MVHHVVFTDEQFKAIQRVGKLALAAGVPVVAQELWEALRAGRVVYGLDEVTDDFLTCADIDCRAIFPRDVTEGYDDGWEHTLCPDHARDEAKDREERREEREEVEA